MLIALICLLAGLVLGQRFKVLVLFPAVGVALALAMASGALHADAFSHMALVAVASIVSLQVGYFLGLGIRSMLSGARDDRSHVNPLVGPAPARRPVH
jgi:hypothetical protein